MPEWPEMEHYRQELNKRLQNRTISGITVNRPKSLNVPEEEFRAAVLGAVVERVDRRAKQLVFVLSGERYLLLHLMLGGMMVLGTEADKPDRTTQIELHFGETVLYFIGLRLGYLHLYGKRGLEAELASLGPEPFDADLTAGRFADMLKTGKGNLKTSLTDQHWLAGVGNCYSDEICFAAGLLPSRRPAALEEHEAARLYTSMRSVLTEALRAGGYMEMPLYDGDERTGGFNELCRVYDRGGEPCVRCGNPIVFRTLSSRKCFFCGNCQT
ncbi:Fpg/Nei family DNA glycosylase [Paenibacillus chitinolyticus]